MSEYNNTKIYGDGTIGEGKYNNIKIMGNATATGDVECVDLVIMGDGEFKGSLKAKNIKIMGDSNFHGCLEANILKVYGDTNSKDSVNIDELKVYGDFKINKNLESNNEMSIMGEMHVEENLKGKNISIMGELEVKKNLVFSNINVFGEMNVFGNCEGDFFRNKGKANIDGLLSADKIEIVPKEISKIEEIGGSEIIIKKSGWIDITGGKVLSKLIEGDSIILQNTICNVVRGHDITILSGCSIEKVEYTGKLTIDKNSEVGEQICLRS